MVNTLCTKCLGSLNIIAIFLSQCFYINLIVNLVSGKSNNHLSKNPKSRISFRGKVADEFIKANQAASQNPKKQSFFQNLCQCQLL